MFQLVLGALLLLVPRSPLSVGIATTTAHDLATDDGNHNVLVLIWGVIHR